MVRQHDTQPKKLGVRDMSTAGVSDKELEGEMSYALHFSLERAQTFLENVPPVVFLGCVTVSYTHLTLPTILLV